MYLTKIETNYGGKFLWQIFILKILKWNLTFDVSFYFQEKVTFLLPSKDKGIKNSEKAALVTQVDTHSASHSQHSPHRVVNKRMFKPKSSKEARALIPGVPYKPVDT